MGIQIKKGIASILVFIIVFSNVSSVFANINTMYNTYQLDTLDTDFLNLQIFNGHYIPSDLYIGNLNPEQMIALREITLAGNDRGILGFEDINLSSNQMVRVTVLFESSPARIQIIEQQVQSPRARGVLTLTDAEQIVEQEHTQFLQDINSLFNDMRPNIGGRPVLRQPGDFRILSSYRNTLNGVTLELPASAVELVAQFDSVRLIVPDFYVDIPPIQTYSTPNGNPWGMSPGRERMNVDILHSRGITGEGVLIAVLDTGIDWEHPAFAGTYPTIEFMRSRGATHLTNADGIHGRHLPNGTDTYYYVGRDFVGEFWTSEPWRGNPALSGGNRFHNPKETSPINFPQLPSNQWTSHGTHVAGTIVGRPVSGADENWSILGVAPNAVAFHHRVLMGSTPGVVITSSVEYLYYLNPDVVNMSLGGGVGVETTNISAIQINNIMLSNPNITFVIANGNSGPGYTTNGNWAASTMGISVGSSVETHALGITRGLNLYTNGTKLSETFFLYAATTIGLHWVWDEDVQSFVQSFPRVMNRADVTFHANGGTLVSNDTPVLPTLQHEFRIFNMPVTGSSANAQDGLGSGEAADFYALVERYGLEELQGAWVLIRRGTSFVDIANRANQLGLGGIIQINGPGQAPIHRTAQRGESYISFFGILHSNGLNLRNAISSSSSDYLSVHFSSVYADETEFSVSGFSSRGPLPDSHWINPDIIANGSNVFSAVPWWTAEQVRGAYQFAYMSTGGTSMAAPHIAGAVALMVQYSRDRGVRGGQGWDNREIRTRLQNTAGQGLQRLDYGVFDIGAGQANVAAAIDNRTVVAVDTQIPILPGANFVNQDFAFADTGAFSFGSMTNTSAGSRTMFGTIYNQTNQTNTYTLTAQFTPAGRNSQTGATFSFNTSTVMVPAGGFGRFNFTINVPANASLGNYEGHVYVRLNGDVVARLPFALSVIETVLPWYSNPDFMGIMRPIISGFIRENEQQIDIRQQATLSVDALTNSNRSGFVFNIQNPNHTGSYGVAGVNGPPAQMQFAVHDAQNNIVAVNPGTWNIPTNANFIIMQANLEILPRIGGVNLSDGIYTWVAHINTQQGTLPFPVGQFVVTSTRPVVNFAQDIFHFEYGNPVTIYGYIQSAGHDMAIANGIRAWTTNNIANYTFSVWNSDMGPLTTNILPNGQFSFVLNPTLPENHTGPFVETINTIFIESVGAINSAGAIAGSNVSELTGFTISLYNYPSIPIQPYLPVFPLEPYEPSLPNLVNFLASEIDINELWNQQIFVPIFTNEDTVQTVILPEQQEPIQQEPIQQEIMQVIVPAPLNIDNSLLQLNNQNLEIRSLIDLQQAYFTPSDVPLNISDTIAPVITQNAIPQVTRTITPRVVSQPTSYESISHGTQLSIFAVPFGITQTDTSITLSIEIGNAIGSYLPTATHEDYDFYGFNTSADGTGTWIDENTIILGNTVVHAVWDLESAEPAPVNPQPIPINPIPIPVNPPVILPTLPTLPVRPILTPIQILILDNLNNVRTFAISTGNINLAETMQNLYDNLFYIFTGIVNIWSSWSFNNNSVNLFTSLSSMVVPNISNVLTYDIIVFEILEIIDELPLSEIILNSELVYNWVESIEISSQVLDYFLTNGLLPTRTAYNALFLDRLSN